ncbi:hypothetical protein Bsp3421_002025 [Burkholderia sp. FERM BP-3421]|uniref:hypothetical protein n=1 Tax=Burkholderia sp. FERM BP-3421 TaxID=1494466 RepID=UPI0023609A37|nr:hypothetical protein [Burkholderia sp. FERM BP-3421]WDD92054.1 hypothetical protein Bsp3421_002025 [Burkholderia sp. FERM BP-3421]
MKVDVHATGAKLGELLEVDDLPVDVRDPVRMFVDLVDAGFCIPATQGAATPGTPAPRVGWLAERSDDAPHRIAWRLDVPDGLLGHLLIARNLLRMRGVDAAFLDGDAAHGTPLTIGRDYPRLPAAPPYPFQLELDESAPIPGCTVSVQYHAPLDAARARQLCEQFSVWGKVAMCGGFAPPDVDPSAAGTLFVAAFQQDPRTIALEFDVCFAVDFACFDLLNARLLHGHAAGETVVDVIAE